MCVWVCMCVYGPGVILPALRRGKRERPIPPPSEEKRREREREERGGKRERDTFYKKVKQTNRPFFRDFSLPAACLTVGGERKKELSKN